MLMLKFLLLPAAEAAEAIWAAEAAEAV